MTPGSHRLWLLLSPALPVGGYSYSQGLEYAVAQQQVTDFPSSCRWIQGLAHHVLPHVDLPLLLRLYRALTADDRVAFSRWNRQLLALRETPELRQEDLSMGEALLRLLRELHAPQPAADRRAHSCAGEASRAFAVIHNEKPTFAAALACAGYLWGFDEQTLCEACAWIWCENQVAAAIKLVPLGHSDGQRLLLTLADELSAFSVQAQQCRDDDLGLTATGQAIASARHENQPARLFRS